MLLSIGPSFETLMRNRSFTGNLMIPNKIAYFPIIIMFVNILLRSLWGIWLEIKKGRTA